MNKVKIGPTLACADLMNMERDVNILDHCRVNTYHIDIMDGDFVHNYCLSWDFVRSLRNITKTPIDIHLMTLSLERDIRTAFSLSIQAIAFHIEAAREETLEFLSLIKNNGVRAGLAVSPDTSIDSIEKYMTELDYVLVMGVKPGFSGQKFIEDTYSRVSRLDAIRRSADLSFEIYVDGGITEEIGKELVKRGTDSIVAGMPTIFREKGKLAKELCII